MYHDGEPLLTIELNGTRYNFVSWSGEICGLQRFSPNHAQFILKRRVGTLGAETFFDLPNCPSNLGLREGHDVVVAALANPLTVRLPGEPKSSVVLCHQRHLCAAVHNRTLQLVWSMDDCLVHAFRQLDSQVASQLLANNHPYSRTNHLCLTSEEHLERRIQRSPSSGPIATYVEGSWINRNPSQPCETEDAWLDFLMAHCINALWGQLQGPIKTKDQSSSGGW